MVCLLKTHSSFPVRLRVRYPVYCVRYRIGVPVPGSGHRKDTLKNRNRAYTRVGTGSGTGSGHRQATIGKLKIWQQLLLIYYLLYQYLVKI